MRHSGHADMIISRRHNVWHVHQHICMLTFDNYPWRGHQLYVVGTSVERAFEGRFILFYLLLGHLKGHFCSFVFQTRWPKWWNHWLTDCHSCHLPDQNLNHLTCVTHFQDTHFQEEAVYLGLSAKYRRGKVRHPNTLLILTFLWEYNISTFSFSKTVCTCLSFI